MTTARFRHKYDRVDDDEGGPHVRGSQVEPGQCSFFAKESEEPCGNMPFLHIAFFQDDRVQTLEACSQHWETAMAAAQRESRFVNDHRYQFGMCDKAVDFQCHKGRLAREDGS